MLSIRLPALSLVLLLATAPAVLADRAPTPEERAAIEEVLRAEGFVTWEEIEFDDGRWEVDDARTEDGTEYDLKLAPDGLAIVERDRDD